jgi:hypothetical protein
VLKNKSLKVWASLLVSTLLLLWVAIYNGFPIVYSDTSTYLASGFEFETPADRPITYGLFIFISSLGGQTLWLTTFLQSLIIAYVIYLVVKYFSNTKSPSLSTIVFVFLLSFISSLPWISGMLLADIFTPITILSLLLLIFVPQLTKTERIFLYFIFFLSNAMHMSHLLINAFLVSTILLSTYILYFKSFLISVSKKQLYLLLFLALSAIAIMSSAMSKSKHIFYMGRMVENGILKNYLDEACATKNYKLCAYKDSLPPNADRFLWDFENSPVYKLGGWKTTKKEFNEIISATLTDPNYLKLHVFAAIENSTRQLSEFNLGEGNIAFGKGTVLEDRIGLFIPNDAMSYNNSKQTNNEWSLFNDFNPIQKAVVYGSLLLLLLIITVGKMRKNISPMLFLLIVFVLIGVLYNDVVCASLSTVANRFAVRVIWLLPFLVFLVILNYWKVFSDKKKSTQHK